MTGQDRGTELILVHGWGFGPSVWDGLRDRFGLPAQVVDLGYSGTARMPAIRGRQIGIGHSFGALWLLRTMPQALAGLVLINGFARFTAAPDWPGGQPSRPLERMQRQLPTRPLEVLNGFRARCAGPPWTGQLDSAALGADLAALGSWDMRRLLQSSALPVLCLAAPDDPLVSPVASRATAGLADTDCRFSPDGGHLLPLTRPDWCMDQIAAFLATT